MSKFGREYGNYVKRQKQQDDDEEGLLVFGYSSRIYVHDSHADRISGDGHLQPWPGDDSLMIDRGTLLDAPSGGTSRIITQQTTSATPNRFDCRLLLHSIDEKKGKEEKTREEEKEEKEYEEERWRDLHHAELEALREETQKRDSSRGTEIGFSYDSPQQTPSTSTAPDGESDSEDEPFVPPPGIKLPVGLETPDNQKLNHVIEKTATFVVKQGPQMEIVIKAKQRNNNEQFGFLHFDHPLNAYYKYIQKLIREGKYVPNFDKKKKNAEPVSQLSNGSATSAAAKKSSALAAIAAQHNSDSDSDSDCELHPSLLAASRRGGSPDPVEKGDATFAGPKKRPKTPPPVFTRTDYKIETANDSYSALFKNLAHIHGVKKEKEVVENIPISTPPPAVPSPKPKSDVDPEWEDFSNWFDSFYGYPPPQSHQVLPYVPPPPDLEKVVCSYARYVAENGPHTENSLKNRSDLQLHFLQPTNRHHLYYLSTVRHAQWEANVEEEHRQHTALQHAAHPPPPPLNRKQRRSGFADAPQIRTAPVPSIVDPLALSLGVTGEEAHLIKSASSPGFLLSSFTDGAPDGVSLDSIGSAPTPPPSASLTGITLQACPAPPTQPNLHGLPPAVIAPPGVTDIQGERQLKARLFMEKILNDKRKKKQDDEDAVRTKEVTAMEEGEIEDLSDGKEIDDEKKKKRRSGEKKKEKLSAEYLDALIKQKMDVLLKGTSINPSEPKKDTEEKKVEKEEPKKSKESEREDRDRKRKKTRKRSRSRSRSRSRRSSPSDDERRRRRRRSRSSELPSRYRRR